MYLNVFDADEPCEDGAALTAEKHQPHLQLACSLAGDVSFSLFKPHDLPQNHSILAAAEENVALRVVHHRRGCLSIERIIMDG